MDFFLPIFVELGLKLGFSDLELGTFIAELYLERTCRTTFFEILQPWTTSARFFDDLLSRTLLILMKILSLPFILFLISFSGFFRSTLLDSLDLTLITLNNIN